jgi:hypothetical protein
LQELFRSERKYFYGRRVKPKKPRQKTCKGCGQPFDPWRSTAKCCSWECAHNYAVKKRLAEENAAAKADRKTVKLRLEELKPLSYYADRAQRAVNSVIRERDKDEPCISCGRFHQGKWNAGHYISRGASPALRYHSDNIHKQCEPCNTNKSGNQIEYRKRLIQKIGIERVEWLEGPHELPRWRKEDYLRIEAEAKQKLKEIKG